jgi:hypothetical protein
VPYSTLINTSMIDLIIRSCSKINGFFIVLRLGAGHYTARALNGTQWCEFNDSSAYPMGTPMNEKVCSREAYML